MSKFKSRPSTGDEIVGPHRFVEYALKEIRAHLADAVKVPILARVAKL